MITKAQLLSLGVDKKTGKYGGKNAILAAIKRGEVTEAELRDKYSDFRKQIMSQVKNVQSSDIPFLPGSVPSMKKARNLVGERDLINELAEGLRFYHSKSYTRKQRVAQRTMALQKMKEHGIDITPDRYDDWRRFMQWFTHTEYATIADSDQKETLDIFEQGSTVEEWERLFKEYKENYRKKGL